MVLTQARACEHDVFKVKLKTLFVPAKERILTGGSGVWLTTVACPDLCGEGCLRRDRGDWEKLHPGWGHGPCAAAFCMHGGQGYSGPDTWLLPIPGGLHPLRCEFQGKGR